jgi:serine/threonine-protein kinase RIO1
MALTTIKLSKETKKRLDNLREYKKESYDEILGKILSVLNMSKLDPLKARRILGQIYMKRMRLKDSKVYSAKELEDKFNL